MNYHARLVTIIMYMLLLFWFVFFGCSKADKTYLDYVRQCKEKDYISVVSNVRIYRTDDGVTQLFDYDLLVKETSNVKQAKVVCKTEKCASAENRTCSKFPDVKLPGPCKFMNITQLPIKNIFACLDKKLVDCTFHKGLYKGRKCVLDLANFQMFTLGNDYWKTSVAVIGNNKNYLCFDVMVHIA